MALNSTLLSARFDGAYSTVTSVIVSLIDLSPVSVFAAYYPDRPATRDAIKSVFNTLVIFIFFLYKKISVTGTGLVKLPSVTFTREMSCFIAVFLVFFFGTFIISFTNT